MVAGQDERYQAKLLGEKGLTNLLSARKGNERIKRLKKKMIKSKLKAAPDNGVKDLMSEWAIIPFFKIF